MPNGSVTTYHDNCLPSSVITSGEGEETSRMLSWQQQDQLGRTTLFIKGIRRRSTKSGLFLRGILVVRCILRQNEN